MSEWKTYKLGNLVEITSSKRIMRSEYLSEGIPFFRSKEIIELNHGNSISTELFISSNRYEGIKRKFGVPQNGDMLLTSVGTLGIPYLVQEKDKFYFKDGNLTWFRNFNEKLSNKFLFYWINSPIGKARINKVSIGSTQKALTISSLKSLDIELPPIYQQLKIVNILDSLSQKIQLNTQTNQTLEAIAQAIFKSWFVDFDPVRAKIQALSEGKSEREANLSAMSVISGKAIEDLSQTEYQELWQIADAFPSELVENTEFGEVPKGWEIKPFGDLLSNTIGGDWGKDELDEKHTEQVFVFRGTDLSDVYKGDDRRVPIRFIQNSKLKNRKLQNGDIVIEVSGGSKNQPTGRSLFITDLLLSRFEQPIVPASFCRLFRPKTEEIGLILGLHLQKIYQEGKTWQYQNQSTGISNFQTTVFLENEMVVLPCEIILDFFAERINPIFGKIYSNENQILAQTRDLLLPKLLSGDVEL